MIVKCQKPLFTTGCPTVLIYNKSRSIQQQTTYTREWQEWFGRKLKRYAQAKIEGTELVIGEVVEDRNW